MYCFNGKVRYSEVNSEKKLTLPALLDYLQDCCTMQSEELGVGVDYLKEQHRAWILSSWEIKIHRYPELGEEIKVFTWPYAFKGFYGFRNFSVERADGEQLATANSVWVFVDTDTMRPVKVSEKMLEVYEFEAQLPGEWAPRKVSYEGNQWKKDSFMVQRFHIDTNHHMNNGKYVLAAEEYLPEDFETKTLRVEYRKAARLGDEIFPSVIQEAGKNTVVLMDNRENPYAIMEFKE